MASFECTIEVATAPEAVFAYLADLANAARWDPSVVEAAALDDGPIGVGSKVAMTVTFYGRRVQLTSELVVHEPPSRLVHRARGRPVRSSREFELAPASRGTIVTYRSRANLAGPLRIFDRGLQLPFARIGEQSCARLVGELGTPDDGGTGGTGGD